ncbi:MAG: alanine--tRNA ligase [Acholeplasmataceae bacterium]|nr:alanine--tRNA ligase [Acholeplasmataceae bacterium]
MRYMSSKDIRETWLRFFNERGHKIEQSASLIPKGDKTLLWINAGVAPLKKYFDGTLIPSSKRLVNVQKCIRTNDIEHVGFTARHHTFFEMMGNFSIGDYFKEIAIEYGLELLTGKDYFNMPVDKLYMTYYPADLTTQKKWLSLGIKESHIIPVEGNFWEIGEGPSGPDTEIFFDRGEKYDKRGVELIKEDIENDRYIEIWNIVFSQFNAKPNMPRSEYKELPSKNIDTGAGLERFACILQNTETNFETDLFLPIIKEIEVISKTTYQGQISFKVIADHIKTLVMAISDGAVLSNLGRGYVLRRLLRRALKHGRQLGIEGPFLTKLTAKVSLIMGDTYPNVKENMTFINQIISVEEIKFLETLSTGESLIKKIMAEKGTLSKEDSFTLFDTYGFPIELQEEYATDYHIQLDKEGFNQLLELQKEKSRQSRKSVNSMKSQDKAYLDFKEESIFVGYELLAVQAKVIKVFEDGVVLDKTPFYATMGGQVADSGDINGYEVKDVIKLPNGQHLHVVDGHFDEGEIVEAVVDKNTRGNIMKNHTATHLLHKALKEVLGTHVNQQGSLVKDDLLRFDFNHYESPTHEQLLEIEDKVKSHIKQNTTVTIKEMPYLQAVNTGAMALFGEKYGEVVRVVSVADYSIELCGGTHVKNTQEIESFLISSCQSIGSGIYRIEAFSGANYINNFILRNEAVYEEMNLLLTKHEQLIKEIKSLNLMHDYQSPVLKEVKGSYQDMIHLRNYIEHLKEDNKTLEKQINSKKDALTLSHTDELIQNRKNNLIVTKNLETNILRSLLFEIYDKMKVDKVYLLNISDDKVTYMVKTNQNDAREIIKHLNEISNGSGGGKPDFAQGGTSHTAKADLLISELSQL